MGTVQAQGIGKTGPEGLLSPFRGAARGGLGVGVCSAVILSRAHGREPLRLPA